MLCRSPCAQNRPTSYVGIWWLCLCDCCRRKRIDGAEAACHVQVFNKDPRSWREFVRYAEFSTCHRNEPSVPCMARCAPAPSSRTTSTCSAERNVRREVAALSSSCPVSTLTWASRTMRWLFSLVRPRERATEDRQCMCDCAFWYRAPRSRTRNCRVVSTGAQRLHTSPQPSWQVAAGSGAVGRGTARRSASDSARPLSRSPLDATVDPDCVRAIRLWRDR
jgi:hypothetical protein